MMVRFYSAKLNLRLRWQIKRNNFSPANLSHGPVGPVMIQSMPQYQPLQVVKTSQYCHLSMDNYNGLTAFNKATFRWSQESDGMTNSAHWK